jgi:uroporphyrin-III C-methyltransferase/precorrin-2 dehydrogenase/sirohydrochlorin ferrochelatase
VARALFPAFLDLVGRRVLVVGGGRVASEKVPRLLEAGAHVVLVAPQVVPAIEALPVEVHRRPFVPADLDACWYVVSAAPHDVNARVVRLAARRAIFVNAVDDPANATAFAGSGFRRGPVTVALSTGGEAPALARVLREALSALIGSDVQDWAMLARRLRTDWRRERVPMTERRNALLAALARLHDEAEASGAPTRGVKPPAAAGFVSLVGAGPGDPELLTRKAARRLAEADLVLYDALVEPSAISLATRAQRIFVGRRRGSDTLGQDAIIRTMIRAARRGRRVVRLKGGDPFVFGRGGDEALALQAAGVPYEIVPGVSSALAAPAAAGIPVTHRGLASAVLVTTGHDPERFATLALSLPPRGVTLVLLMATEARAEIAVRLRDAGWPPATPAALISNATQPDERVWWGTLATLSAADVDQAPGTIVIGDVVAVGAALAGVERHRLPAAVGQETQE